MCRIDMVEWGGGGTAAWYCGDGAKCHRKELPWSLLSHGSGPFLGPFPRNSIPYFPRDYRVSKFGSIVLNQCPISTLRTLLNQHRLHCLACVLSNHLQQALCGKIYMSLLVYISFSSSPLGHIRSSLIY